MEEKYIEYADGVVASGMFQDWLVDIKTNEETKVTKHTFVSPFKPLVSRHPFGFSCLKNSPLISENFALQQCGKQFAYTLFREVQHCSRMHYLSKALVRKYTFSRIDDILGVLPNNFFKNEIFAKSFKQHFNTKIAKTEVENKNLPTTYIKAYKNTLNATQKAVQNKFDSVATSKSEKSREL